MVIGGIIELKATKNYVGIYFVAHDTITNNYVCDCHLSLMHSRLYKGPSEDQVARVLLRCRQTMIGLDVFVHGEMTLVHNPAPINTLRRAYINLVGLSPLTTRMWEVRNMICNFLGPSYGEHRDDFHASFDRVAK